MKIKELVNVIEDCATITIQIKDSYYDERFDIQRVTYYPSVRLQSQRDFTHLQEKYGGCINERLHLTTWVWNIPMIKKYFPLIIPHLRDKTKEKAEIVLEVTKYCHGRGISQDKEKLKELYFQIKKLQEPPHKQIAVSLLGICTTIGN